MREPNYLLRINLPYTIDAGKLAVVFVFLGNIVALIVVLPSSSTVFFWNEACPDEERLVRHLCINVKVLMRCDINLHVMVALSVPRQLDVLFDGYRSYIFN